MEVTNPWKRRHEDAHASIVEVTATASIRSRRVRSVGAQPSSQQSNDRTRTPLPALRSGATTQRECEITGRDAVSISKCTYGS